MRAEVGVSCLPSEESLMIGVKDIFSVFDKPCVDFPLLEFLEFLLSEFGFFSVGIGVKGRRK